MKILKKNFFDFFFEKELIEKLLIILFLSIPIVYITGPLITEIVLISLTILFFIKLSKIKSLDKKILIFFLIILSIYFFFNQIILNDIDKNNLKSLFYFRFLIIVPVAFLILNSEKLTRIFLYLILFINIFVIFDIYFQKIFGFDLFGIDALDAFSKGMHFKKPLEDISKVTRYSGPFGDELIAGSFISKFFLINLIFINYELTNNKNIFLKKYQNILIYMFILIYLIGILFTGERSAFVYFIFSLVIYFIFFQFNIKSLISSFFILLILIALILFNPNFYKRFYDSTMNELFSSSSIENVQKKELKYKMLLQNKHLSHYSSALAIFKENVFFGGGFKNYRNICDSKKYECSTHPHNIFLEVLASIGILGFLLFYTIFILYLKLYLKKKGKYHFLYIIFVTLNFLFILPTGSIFNNYFAVLSFYVLAAFMVCLENLGKDKSFMKQR